MGLLGSLLLGRLLGLVGGVLVGRTASVAVRTSGTVAAAGAAVRPATALSGLLGGLLLGHLLGLVGGILVGGAGAGLRRRR